MHSLDFIHTYFTEEKIESLIFIIIGCIAILFSCFFWGIIKYSFFKGMAYPLFCIGLIQVVVGGTVYNRVPKDIERVEQIVKNKTIHLQKTEITRIEIVQQNFVIYKWIEMTLMAISSILIVLFYKSTQTFWKGLGLGLLIQASVMLCLDLIAQKRADIYMLELSKIFQSHT